MGQDLKQAVRFYLAAAELAFRNEGHVVFQIQLAKEQDAVPLTRDYIGVAEADWCRSIDQPDAPCLGLPPDGRSRG